MRKVTASITVLFASACMLFAGKMPAWCTDPYSGLSRNDYIAAVGIADSYEAAAKDAIEQIGSYFNVDVSSYSVSSMSDDGNYATDMFSQDVTVSSSVAGIVGIKRYASYESDYAYYVLMGINKSEVEEYYVTTLKKYEREISYCLESIEKYEGSLGVYRFAERLKELAPVYDDCYGIYSTIKTAGMIGQKYSLPFLMDAVEKAYSSVVIEIDVDASGDRKSSLESIIGNAFSALGFTIADSGDYVVSAAFSDSESRMPGFFLHNTELEIGITDRNGKSVGSFRYKDKATSPLSGEDASRRAFNKVENSIRENFTNEFLSKFSN